MQGSNHSLFLWVDEIVEKEVKLQILANRSKIYLWISNLEIDFVVWKLKMLMN